MITRLLSCFVYWETWERRRQTRSPLWKSSVNFGYKIVGYPSYYFGNMLRLSISEPALELHSRAAPIVRGITTQSVLTQGKIPEEGRTGKKTNDFTF